MTPAEKRKQREERAKLKNYRNRLMALKDVVPNINELWQDNQKIVRFFESGEATKYEGQATSIPTKPIEKVSEKKKIETTLTPEIYQERKAQGINDRTIMAEFGLYVNKFTAWKKENGLAGKKLEGGRRAHKDFVPKSKEGVTEVVASKEAVKVDHSKEQVSELLELLEEKQKLLDAANLVIKINGADLEKAIAMEQNIKQQLELAQKAEKQALEELIQYQAEYRNLEVVSRNQRTELARVNEMLEKLKYTAQINVWLMKQHIGFVEQADLIAGGNQ